MVVRKVIAGVSGSPGSLQALRYAAATARQQDAVLAPVLAWIPPGGELADRRYPCPQLRAVWQQDASDRLKRAIDLAIGGPPADVRFSPAVVKGDAGRVLTALAGQGDVLVIGAGRPGVVRRLLGCRVSRYCRAHATCPVTTVPPTPLAVQAHGLRGWVRRHRLRPQDAEPRRPVDA